MTIYRKLITSFITSSILILGLAIFINNPYGEEFISEQNYIYSTLNIVFFYFTFVFPITTIYGTLTSILSDKIAEKISINYKLEKYRAYISLFFHTIFGLVLLPISVFISTIYYIVDILLKSKNKEYTLRDAIKWLSLPLGIGIFSMILIMIN